tara:strand:+ start:813 stop:920 length:108 start_codon:yes stop_codon:yes gene_type:complete
MGIENYIPEGWVETTLGDISTRKQYGILKVHQMKK